MSVCSSPAQVVCITALAGGRLRANLPWIVLVATVTWLAASPAATAQADWVAERFKQLDRNGDGRLTPAEVPYGNLLRQWDQNSDGAPRRRFHAAWRTPQVA